MSSLPETTLILHGGCNCKAIRYTLSIPSLSDRLLLLPASASTNHRDVRFPLFNIDHCNDCRKGSGSLTNFYIVTPRSSLSFTCLLRDSEEHIQLSGNDLLFPSPAAKKTFVSHYKSSHSDTFDADCIRSFCGRCGTTMATGLEPWKFPIVATASIQMGTLDRESLEIEGVRPERHLFCGAALDWVVDLFSDDGGLTKHPSYSPREAMP